MGSGFRKRVTGNSKNLSYFSHEFIIQNHGDIVTCIFMLFIVGLMFQVTAPIASVFVTPKYNLTEIDHSKATPILYTYGVKDIALVFFYSLAAIIFHAIIQEYILDKVVRKIHLSKTKTSKFNESGQLLAFYLVSLFWCLNIFKEENYFRSLDFFWTGYPHVGLTIWTKLFFIIQMSYWVHVFPELYFQKVKREEIPAKVMVAVVYLFIFAVLYLLNLTRIGVALIFIDYLTGFLFHVSRLIYFSGKSSVSKLSFSLYNLVFIVGRLATCALAVYAFCFGFNDSNVERIDFETRNFNTPITRYTCIFVIVASQLVMFWNFVSFKVKKSHENSKPAFIQKNLGRNRTKKVKNTVSRDTSDGEFESRGEDTDTATQSVNGKVKSN